MNVEEKSHAKAYLDAKETGFERIAKLREEATSKLDDASAVEIFNQIAAVPTAPSNTRPLTGLITQQAWFTRYHLSQKS